MAHIDNTWLAFAFEREVEPERIDGGLRRVEGHYATLYAEPLIRHVSAGRSLGMALWRRADERLRWSLWADREGMAVATTNAPTGGERLLGGEEVSALRLGAALRDDPERLVDLNPPFVAGVHDRAAGVLTIVNDFLGAARLYAHRSSAGWVWSNRLGALPIFAGVPPEADPQAWAVHAATGWFMGTDTPIRGVRRVPPATVVVARTGERGARVAVRPTEAVRTLVAPRRSRLGPSAAAAADQAVDLARSVARLWAAPVTVNLSGGRDSRISAAAAIVAGIDAEYRTMDIEPGEVDAVRPLIARAPSSVFHAVVAPERGDPPDDLDARIRAKHLVHDGVSNPMSTIRGPTNLPQRGFSSPLITGHGGELGHGFYYGRSSLRSLRRGGFEGLVRRLERTVRRGHSAARDDAYGAFLAAVRATLDEGRGLGIEGPSLLDYFYLAQRLSLRAGLGSRNDRYSGCVTPAFVRAAFDLSPRQRVGSKLHRAVIERLIPEWRRIPFFAGGRGRLPRVNRARIWERPSHAGQLEAMLERESLWADMFVPRRVHEMWAEVKRGGGHAHYEAIFLRIAWRVSYEDHLGLLARRAA
ncbi:MAG TPA: hypothetical protein VH391_05810 [Solirubrobacterales bacterium]